MSSFDTISKLPDEVLCHILSFLSTKDAITTSILSKRWKRLWLSVPVLDFKELEINEAQPPFHFCRMVYATMLKRHVSQPVKRFCLSCLGDSDACDSSDVSTWVGAAIQRGVEDLDLILAPEISLPSGIVGSRTLVVLKLAYLTIDDVFADGFPSLKMMELEYVLFKEHRHLTQLLFGCPILEVLEVVGPLVADFTEGEFPTLEKLVSADLSFSHTSIPWKWICNVKFLRVLEEFPSCKVTCTFSNLMILELIVKTYNLSWLVETLQHCPKLQSLAIEKRGGDNDDIDDNEWVQPQFVPECLSSHLRTCSLINYRGRERELQFSKYIMKNAKVLHTMRICCHTSADLVAKFEMIKKLSLCPRSSIACKLSFE